MKGTKEAREMLRSAIKRLIGELEETAGITADSPDQFAYGIRTASVAFLEMLQEWKGAKKNGLDFEIEDRYPL